MPSQALVPASKQKKRNTHTTEDVTTETPAKTDTAAEALEASAKVLDEIDRLLDGEAVRTLAESLKGFDPTEERPYSLAQAMREGCAATDQAIGAWTTEKGETCALSAAMLAVRARGLA